VLERRGHVAEARRAAEREPGAVDEVLQLAVRRTLRGIAFSSPMLVNTRGTVRRRAAAPGTRSMPSPISSAMRRTEPPTL
jgi:hypothetical protein